MATIKKKRVSKKKKASWRKHSDINDVEEFLEDKRQEERIGTFSEKKDDELFQVDVAVPKKRSALSAKKTRRANATKPLKSLSALKNTSSVQDPIVKRNHVKQKNVKRNVEEEILNPKLQKHIQANKDRLRYYEKLDKRISKDRSAKEFSKDIWKEEDVRDRLPGLKNDWVSKELSGYVLRNTGKGSVKVHDSLRHKTTKAKAFEPPAPGMSYNPSLQVHQALIREVMEKEQKIIKLEEHLKRVTTKMFMKVTPEERDRRRMKEMSAGLDSVGDEAAEEEEKESIGGAESSISANPPVVNKKKSKQKRRKEKERKLMTNELKKKKELKKQRADIHKIRKITSEVDKESEELNEKKKQRKLVAKKKKFETKRLGRLKFKEPDTDVNMPNDIAGNLRNVKMESTLIVDRFKNFQKRNILPASVEVGKTKRRKIKRFPRSSHKEPGVSISKKK